MNIHPIFVHFPIALLTVYAVIELIRIPKFQAKDSVFYIKGVLVVLGWLSSIVAASTGEIAEHLVPRSQLIETHSVYAGATQIFFGIIAFIYILTYLERETIKIPFIETYVRKILTILFMITKKVQTITPILALAGLVCVTITGALGGAIVYGPDIDPVVRFIYNLLL